MKKLELKHVAPYLSYGLKCKYVDEDKEEAYRREQIKYADEKYECAREQINYALDQIDKYHAELVKLVDEKTNCANESLNEQIKYANEQIKKYESKLIEAHDERKKHLDVIMKYQNERMKLTEQFTEHTKYIVEHTKYANALLDFNRSDITKTSVLLSSEVDRDDDVTFDDDGKSIPIGFTSSPSFAPIKPKTLTKCKTCDWEGSKTTYYSKHKKDCEKRIEEEKLAKQLVNEKKIEENKEKELKEACSVTLSNICVTLPNGDKVSIDNITISGSSNIVISSSGIRFVSE